MLHKHLLTGLLALAATSLSLGQKNNAKDWDVANPKGNFNYKNHEFTTNEGTWMNLDVSPDGKTLVFDLLGDIYSMPISGGKAKVLRSGIPFEVQPRFSPDGTHIAFTSDAGGGDNIWVMKADGSEARAVTEENFRLLNNPYWTPDGQYIVARKHFTSQRSLGAGEIWQYHISGGSGTQLTKRKNDQQDVNEPNISPDGRYLYYSEDVYPGGFFQYNKDPNKEIYVIKRYDMETGETTKITGGPGGAARPQLSRDGKLLAFVKRVRTKSVLYLHDLATGEEWPVFSDLNKDQKEAWAIFGVYPNYSWLPGDSALVFWSKGKINKLDINTLAVTNIPFTVEASIPIAETVHFSNPVDEDSFDPKVIRHAVTSPDGKTLVFNALGQLWTKKLPNGTPKRLTNATHFEAEPSFSPNGKEVVYVSWDDARLGAIHKVALSGGASTQLTTKKGIYRNPAFNAGGTQIVFHKESGNTDQGLSFANDAGLYTMPVNGGEMTKVSEEGQYPQFSVDGQRILYQTGGTYFGSLTKELKSVNLNGKDPRTHIKSKYANRLVPSPDNKWIAFTHLHKAYVAPLLLTGKPLDLDNNSTFVPVAQLAKDSGINLHWSKDSQQVHWTLGNRYYANDIKDRYTFLPESPEKAAAMDTVGIAVGLSVPRDRPQGSIAFTNARIITMENGEVIENGTLVVANNKIAALGPAETVKVPANARIMDASGKTIMPGLVDAHAHIGGFRYGLTPQKHWQFYANLAFGVTTAHDPSANSESIFAMAELIKSGKMVGPRLYSTGIILYGADGDFKAPINSLEDARSSIRRTKAYGAQSVKSYNQPRREQRQQVMQAARELGINVVPEGGSTFYHNMSMIMDGHTGIEHNIPVAPVYKDVLELWKTSKTGYTPTLIVTFGGINGEYYFYQHDKVWENEKLLKYTPRALIDARSRYRTMVPEEEYENGHILVSRTAKALADQGVKVNMGAHGQLQGLGAHWELWMLHQGGMTEMEALEAATINSAHYIGAGQEIGSLKEGKLADLILLDKNPLENIRHTESVTHTMVNGRLYDTDTMDQVWPTAISRGSFWWENNKYNGAFPWHEQAQSFTRPGCGCHLGH
ncbi:amidohydrolase family protein [Maribacter sp. 2307ULW6-5]|uniref:amidohydrolase family protein n=1 Tax=Maribacter sp. 2307ULW6-5 TaxID=3386275 RepID=UPI0039BC4F6C